MSDLTDHKPGLANLRGADLPDSIRHGNRKENADARILDFYLEADRKLLSLGFEYDRTKRWLIVGRHG